MIGYAGKRRRRSQNSSLSTLRQKSMSRFEADSGWRRTQRRIRFAEQAFTRARNPIPPADHLRYRVDYSLMRRADRRYTFRYDLRCAIPNPRREFRRRRLAPVSNINADAADPRRSQRRSSAAVAKRMAAAILSTVWSKCLGQVRFPRQAGRISGSRDVSLTDQLSVATRLPFAKIKRNTRPIIATPAATSMQRPRAGVEDQTTDIDADDSGIVAVYCDAHATCRRARGDVGWLTEPARVNAKMP